VKVVIMGCGRVGSELASVMDNEGNEVTVLDLSASAFSRLPSSFGGTTLLGNGIDVDVLRRSGVPDADAFVAVTQGDNRNVMAAQIAQHIFKVPDVVCRIYDPIREQMYRSLGLKTISPTKIGAQLIKEALSR
jgi:trk system potassium uptake protein